MIPGTLIQEEIVAHAADAPSHAAIHARYRAWLGRRNVTLEIKDNARLPAYLDLFEGDLMLGHGFNLLINGMAVGVEGFAGHCGGQVRWLEQRTVKGAAQQTLGIVQIE